MRHVSSTPSPSFVDPSSLSLPSPPSEAASSPQSPAIDPSLVPTGSTSSSVGPSRKRARTDATPEEKREARAHRNRIAAQNSRDKRKVQFSQLEDKVRTLQQENEQLRAQLEQERQRRNGAEKDRENAELKERVKSLEEGWEAVLKALQSQGLPSSAFPNASKTDEPPPSSISPVDDSTRPQPPSPTFPVFINTSPVLLPSSPLSVAPGIPQPVHQSNDEPTRHLARVATRVGPSSGLQYHPLTSTSDCCLRRLPRTQPRASLRHRQTRIALKNGSGKSLRRPIVAPSGTLSPVQRRRLLAYLLLALVQSRKPPPQM
ncbi:hypothetical protein JB92DRAFT_3081467 [Gautieria morchelliformis]|nr:hypothetical protein JB92DRAFT_3081467 [Gautieria morchelliformis]